MAIDKNPVRFQVFILMPANEDVFILRALLLSETAGYNLHRRLRPASAFVETALPAVLIIKNLRR